MVNAGLWDKSKVNEAFNVVLLLLQDEVEQLLEFLIGVVVVAELLKGVQLQCAMRQVVNGFG